MKEIFPVKTDMAAAALKWILQFNEVSCIIPGASNPQQVLSNINALSADELSGEQRVKVQQVYEAHIKPLVHHLW